MHEIVKKPRRRWFRFSLRTFFVLLTMLCVWLAMVANSARRQREATEWAEKNSGYIMYDWERDSHGRFNPQATPPGPAWLRAWIGDDYFQSIVILRIRDEPVRDLTPLQGLTRLEQLSLYMTEVEDVTLLANFKQLKILNLRSNPITDLAPLVNLPQLEQLDLERTKVENIAPLADLRRP